MMARLAATLPLFPRLLLAILALLPLLGSVSRWWLVRVARVLPELLEKLGYLLFQRCDAPPLLGDDRIFPRQLGLKLCDSIVSPVAYNLLRDSAEQLSIPYTIHAAGRESWTDADAIHVAREGIATALLSIPNRYMHSPNEMVSLEDLDRAASLIAETCRAVSAETDFTAR